MTLNRPQADTRTRSEQSLFGVECLAAAPQRSSDLAVHFSSRTDCWATPPDFFAELDREFGFDLDVCALPENAKCSRFFTPEQDGLSQEWRGVCWMNPPYGREIAKWMRKAYESAEAGATVVCLVPARTDTRWWHRFVTKAAEVRFVKGRLRFGDSSTSAPFPSAVVIFRPPRKGRRSTRRACFAQLRLFPPPESHREPREEVTRD